jgi:ribosomal protein S19E (S16A)
MKRLGTVREIPASVFLASLARLIKDLRVFRFRRVAAPPAVMAEFEDWFYQQVANLLFKLYLTPSILTPPFVPPERSGPEQLYKGLRALQAQTVHSFMKHGWIKKDRTGIHTLHPDTRAMLDALAKDIPL